MVSKRNSIFALLLLALVSLVGADVITTNVFFNVPTSVAFTLTLPGLAANSSGHLTTFIEYNHSSNTVRKVNASAGGTAQSAAVPIFNYSNTGNVIINISLVFNESIPATINVSASKADGGYQLSCNVSAGAYPNTTTCKNVTNAGANITNISISGYQEIWMWADFNNLPGGSSVRRTLSHVSALDKP